MQPPASAPRPRRLSAKLRAEELVQAGLRCLARGGITAFTIDQICAEAKASRGLISHHFGGKDGLLAAVYAEVYRRTLTELAMDSDDPARLIDAAFGDASADNLRIWLALWGEVPRNPVLQGAHHQHYALYRDNLTAAIAHNHPKADASSIAVALIALIDGLWLEVALAPDHLTPDMARAQAHRVLRALLV